MLDEEGITKTATARYCSPLSPLPFDLDCHCIVKHCKVNQYLTMYMSL